MADGLGTAHPLTEPGVWVERIGDRVFPGRLPALFLDRDGTINVDTDYPSNPAEIVLRDDIVPAIAAANRAGIPVVVVTNQSGVGRGYYTEADVHALHAKMSESLAEVGGRIDAYYYCPHHPEAAEEAYRHPDPPDRKPNPGMLLRAMADWPVDAARSIMVGDKAGDIEAGRRAGVRSLRFEGGDLLRFLEAELIQA